MPNKTILVVDDSPTERKMVQQALQGKGYNLVWAEDGEEALEKVARQKPDLVLLDIILPRKNGYQVCRQLKTSPETQNIKVILISSKAQDTDRFWGLKQGADEYLTKPVAAENLAASVAKYC
ncbi:MAG TPA: response regulator [Candidatus Acidoferrales bacterium]|nr:response regulator [Candidatus Acidoferrales bacterium]